MYARKKAEHVISLLNALKQVVILLKKGLEITGVKQGTNHCYEAPSIDTPRLISPKLPM